MTGVPSSTLAALQPPQLQAKHFHSSARLPGEQEAQGPSPSVQLPEEGL